MVEHQRLVDGAGVIVQPAGDGQIHGEVRLRHAEGGEILHHGPQLVKALVKGGVHAPVALQRGEHLVVGAADGHEVHHVFGLAGKHFDLVDQQLAHLFGADLVQLVHGAHDLAGLFAHAVHRVEAVEQLAVVHADLKAADAQTREGVVDDGRDLGLVGDVQLPVADDVDVGLIEFPEAAPLGALAPVDLADLEAAEGEGQLAVVSGDVFCQRHRQIEAQRQIAVALGEAVDLLLGLASALGQQHLGGLDHRRVQRREAVGGVGLAQRVLHALELKLLPGQKLHKAGERARCDFSHVKRFLSEG